MPAQFPENQQQRPQRPEPEDIKLPNGKNQKDEILKADHRKNVSDADRLIELSQQLKEALEKNTEHVLALDDLKRLDEIEKLAKRIRSRIRRF